MNPLILLKVSLLLSVALVAARLLNRAPAATRHGLWSLAFGATLLLAPLAAALPAIYVPVPAGWNTSGSTPMTPVVTAGVTIVSDQPLAASPFDAVTPSTPLEQPEDASDAGLARLKPRPTAISWPSLATLLFAIWLAGVIGATATVLLSLFRVRRLVRTAEVVNDPAWRNAADAIGAQLGLRYPVRLLMSAHVGTPMTGGLWRPAIFLPQSAASWSEEHRDLVLAHELAHLAGRDPFRHLVARLALACYWFHPLAWLAAREAAIAREQACDEAVLALGALPSAYARVLLDLAESISVRPPARFLGALPIVHRSNLEKRLMAILNVDVRPTTRRLVLGPALGVALLTLSVAAAQPALSRVEESFDGTHGTVVVQAPSTPFGRVEGTPAGHVKSNPFGRVEGTPVSRAPVTPFGVVEGTPVGVVPGVPATVVENTPVADSQGGRESACWWDSNSGSFSGSMSSTQSGGRTVVTDMVGWRDGDRIIQRTIGDLKVCMLAEGVGDRNNQERPSQWIGRARRTIIETHRASTVQRLELTGARTSWQVNGSARDFDAAAQAWRDRMLAVLDTTWEVSSIRGEVSSLRGQISAIHGQQSALQGEISALHGAVSAMQGRISTAQGEESRLRGEISAIRGHLSTLQGRISTEQGAKSRLRASQNRVIPLDPGMVDMSVSQREQNRIATQIEDHEAAIARIQREIRTYGADQRIAAVQKEIDSFDADAKASSIERQIRAFDLDGKVAGIQRRIADLDVEGRVARIERQIAALDADRRVRQLEDRLAEELNRLNAAIAAIR